MSYTLHLELFTLEPLYIVLIKDVQEHLAKIASQNLNILLKLVIFVWKLQRHWLI